MHNSRVSSSQHQKQQKQPHTANNTSARNFTNTAKLPIETVKLLIAAVSRKPHLWIRSNNGQKRSDINALWQQVSQEVHLPADICRIKWGHLRDNFRKVFIRNTLSAEPPTTWRFYNDMRFMEAAVAENVMRHHCLREQSLYWQELHNAGQRNATNTPAIPLTETKYDHSLQNQLNFSEVAAIFQNNSMVNKRLKIETSDASQTSLQDSAAMHFDSTRTNKYNTSETGMDEEDPDDDDDDQFDEDAVSAEESLSNPNDNEGNPNNFDSNSLSKVASMPIFNMRQEISTNTEVCSETAEEDSDRMFLLSLLPYMRKVNDKRKLQVRQKLQDVLIEEFG